MAGLSPGARFAFPAMLAGSAVLAFGPWLVRLADVGPIASGFWRLALAAPLLVALAGVTGQATARASPRLWLMAALAGLFFAGDLAAWHVAILRTTLGNSVLFGNASTFAFAAYGFLVARRLPGWPGLLALGMALAGMLLLMGRSYQLSPQHLLGDLLALLAAGFYTAYLIAVERVRGRFPPLATHAAVTVAGALSMLVIASLAGGRLLPGDWTPLVLLALSSQVVGQGLVVFALPHLSPMVSGLCLLVQPVIASAVGWMRYGERMGSLDLIGTAMILAALLLVRLPAATPRRT